MDKVEITPLLSESMAATDQSNTVQSGLVRAIFGRPVGFFDLVVDEHFCKMLWHTRHVAIIKLYL